MQKCFIPVSESRRRVSMSISAALVLMVVALPQSSSAQFAPEQMTVNQTPIRTLTPEQIDMHKARIASGFIGVGVTVDPVSVVRDAVRITAVESDSPAEEAGLEVGNKIFAVAEATVVWQWHNDTMLSSAPGQPISYWSLSQVQHAIQGPSQSWVTLTIVRPGFPMEYVKVKRDLDASIGITMELDNPLTVYQVSSVWPDSPAESAGMAKDDLITAIDGDSVQSMSTNDVLDRIGHGSIGSTVSLTFLQDDEFVETTLTRNIVKDWGRSFGLESRSNGGDRSNLEYNRSIISIKNLDWEGLVPRLDAEIDDLNTLPGAILDLRGASGDDPQIAALVAAHFLPVDCKLMLVRARQGADRFIDLYNITDGTTYRTRYVSDQFNRAIGPARNDSLKVIGVASKHYAGKLVVLVDDYTAGTAEALAYVLQHTGRAQVVGFRTAGRSTISTFFPSANGQTVIAAPTGTLLTLQGKLIQVVPDDSVFWRENLFAAAQNNLAGKHWYNDGRFILAIALALMILSVPFICFVRARKSARATISKTPGSIDSWTEQAPHEFGGVDADLPDEAAAADGNGHSGANWVDALEAVVNDPAEHDSKATSKNQSNRRSSLLLLIPFGLFFGGFIGLPILCQWYFMGAPHGTRARLAVTLYVDGSQLCTDQKQVVDQLASEYSGAIKFETIDIRQHPQVTTGDTAVTTAPETRIAMQWYSEDGTIVRDEWQGSSGPMPKRQIVDSINSMSHAGQRFWPTAVIQRTKHKITGNAR